MIPGEKKLLNLLSNHDVTFFIPPYQRNYEWTKEQCEMFLDDVVKTYESNRDGTVAEHFFGFITFFQTEKAFDEPNELILIDGQQRITTTMLFLVALRDVEENERLKSVVDGKYLKNENAKDDSNEYKIKLKQVETDWGVYVDIVLGREIGPTEKESRVYKNYEYFKSQLRKYKERGILLEDFITKGLSKFSVVSLQLEPDQKAWENPQEIFESMNSIGKPLSLADLVRNYLLLGFDSHKQEELYKDFWLHIEKTLPGQISNYIRDFMQWKGERSYNKATEANYKELYRTFKNLFLGKEAEEILKSLSASAELYSYILPGGRTGKNAIDYELKDLQLLRVSTANSFLLALLERWQRGRFTDGELADILDVFRIYIIRRRILSITGSENQMFPQFVRYIDEIEEAKDKRKAMLSLLITQDYQLRLPNDIELTRQLETLNFYSLKQCRYILSLVEEKLTKQRPEDGNIQIEHIMPQTLNPAWKDELGEKAEDLNREYGNTIGNLTLIRHNQELGNKPFAEKKKVYEEKAGLQIARKEITNRTKWNKNSITNRMNWIIDYLLKEVLLIPDDIRRTNNFRMRKMNRLSFTELQLIGETIYFLSDSSITAKVVGDTEVEFEGKVWKLSPLTAEIFRRKGTLSKSGSYQGSQYWEYDGMRLSSIM